MKCNGVDTKIIIFSEKKKHAITYASNKMKVKKIKYEWVYWSELILF